MFTARPEMFRDNPIKFVVAILLIPVLGLGLLVLFSWWLDCITTTLEVTGDKVVYSTGILSKTRSVIDRTRIRSVRVHQTLMQRLTGVGDLLIFTAGDAPEIVARGMAEPEKLRTMLGH